MSTTSTSYTSRDLESGHEGPRARRPARPIGAADRILGAPTAAPPTTTTTTTTTTPQVRPRRRAAACSDPAAGNSACADADRRPAGPPRCFVTAGQEGGVAANAAAGATQSVLRTDGDATRAVFEYLADSGLRQCSCYTLAYRRHAVRCGAGWALHTRDRYGRR
jgi:hypothetical protein